MAYLIDKIVWEITAKCNMNCLHCGSDCNCDVKGEELTTAECIEVLEDIRDVGGCNLVIFSGGEPLMRDDIGVLTSMCSIFDMKTAVISNAFMVNEKTIKKIKALNLAAYGISIDAASPYMHDYIRGISHAFDHVEKAIKLLHDNGITPTVVTTVHKLNYNQLPKIRDFLIKNKVRLWQIQYGDNIGRMPKECQLTEAQYFEVAKFIYDCQQNYKEHFVRVSGADVFGYMSEFSKKIQRYWCGCQAGITNVGISAEGSIRGCLSMQADKYIEGNVRERSFKEIWQDKNSFAYNRRFDCSMLTGYCKTCMHAAVCRGGCMRAASLSGNRENPYCLYKIEKEGYSSEYQSRIDFSKEEIIELYNPIRPIPEEVMKEL